MNDRVEKSAKSARKPGKVAESYAASFRGYINVDLSDKQKESYEAWAATASYWEALEFNVADGVRLSVKVDPKSGGFIASAAQNRSSSPNSGLVVTARARQAGLALGRLLYTLTILNHSEQWETLQPIANPDRW